MNYGEVFHFSFSWKSDRRFLKYAGVVWLLHALFLLALLGLAFFLFRGLFLSLLSGSYSSFKAMLLDPLATGANAITFFFAAIPFYFVFLLIAFYIQALVFLFGFDLASIKAPRFGLMQFFTLFFIGIAAPFAALFSVYNRRMLLLPLVGIVFVLGSFVPSQALAAGSLALAAVIFTAYLFVFAYNFARLFFSGIVFLERGCSLSEALEESCKITRGKIMRILAAFAAIVLIVGIASSIILISLSLLAAFLSSYYLASNFVVSFALAAIASAMLLCPFQMLCCNFALVSIYKQISEK